MFTPTPIAHWQVRGEEVDITGWPQSEEHPYFPEGSRDKRLLHCPDPAPQPWLIAGHPYLFKKSRNVYPDQFWAEVVASRLARLTRVPVPPAYAAKDSEARECAALIEWFWGYPNSSPQGFLSGGLFMQTLIADFDHKRGTQHNFESIQLLSRFFSNPSNRAGVPRLQTGWLDDWARMLTFDALIGNTDRHQENWGFVFTRNNDGSISFALSPAFDNGTSLGHERPPSQFARFRQNKELQRYIQRGRHHLKWQLHDKKSCGHLELLQKILQQSPATRTAMLSVLDFDPAALHHAILPLCDMTLTVRLTPRRARFMENLLLARQNRLREALQA